MDSDIKLAKNRLFWCPVKKAEDKLASCEKDLLITQNKVEKHTKARDDEVQKLAEAQAKMSDKKGETHRFKVDQQSLKEKLRPLQNTKLDAENAIKSYKVGFHSLIHINCNE